MYEVPPFVNESAVLRSAREALAEPPVPMTCTNANRRVKDLAIRFYPIPDERGGQVVAIAAACPVQGDVRNDLWAETSACITAWHGEPDAAVVQFAHAVMKDKEGWAAEVIRCVTTGLLVYLMPTAVITMTANLLTDAVSNRVEKERGKEGKDFFQAQAICELIRQQEVPGA